tara:strand:- start:280 stop:567 length:288 start_codon:yes stop_codon:yes gene_type:complete
MKKCSKKYRFKSWKEAQAFAESYQKRVPMTFNQIGPYWCNKHESWHIGHDNTKRKDYKDGARIFSDGNGTEILRTDNADVSETDGTVESELSHLD